jgi:hypothetical protein
MGGQIFAKLIKKRDPIVGKVLLDNQDYRLFHVKRMRKWHTTKNPI